MTTASQSNLEAIKDIRKIMERSSRFISLSGWSGIAAGVCALIGAWVAQRYIDNYIVGDAVTSGCPECLRNELMITAAAVFVIALISAFVFTYIKSRKDGVPIWGGTARRLLFNTMLPMAVGGLMIAKIISAGYYDLVVPSTLVFYGLALVNGSKYTMGEVRYLGYAEILTGIISLLITTTTGQLYAWAFGFGVLHIIYGLTMWWKHERKGE
jgi:hypothetical protein